MRFFEYRSPNILKKILPGEISPEKSQDSPSDQPEVVDYDELGEEFEKAVYNVVSKSDANPDGKEALRRYLYKRYNTPKEKRRLIGDLRLQTRLRNSLYRYFVANPDATEIFGDLEDVSPGLYTTSSSIEPEEIQLAKNKIRSIGKQLSNDVVALLLTDLDDENLDVVPEAYRLLGRYSSLDLRPEDTETYLKRQYKTLHGIYVALENLKERGVFLNVLINTDRGEIYVGRDLESLTPLNFRDASGEINREILAKNIFVGNTRSNETELYRVAVEFLGRVQRYMNEGSLQELLNYLRVGGGDGDAVRRIKATQDKNRRDSRHELRNVKFLQQRSENGNGNGGGGSKSSK